jgi:hypothetical protein
LNQFRNKKGVTKNSVCKVSQDLRAQLCLREKTNPLYAIGVVSQMRRLFHSMIKQNKFFDEQKSAFELVTNQHYENGSIRQEANIAECLAGINTKH